MYVIFLYMRRWKEREFYHVIWEKTRLFEEINQSCYTQNINYNRQLNLTHLFSFVLFIWLWWVKSIYKWLSNQFIEELRAISYFNRSDLIVFYIYLKISLFGRSMAEILKLFFLLRWYLVHRVSVCNTFSKPLSLSRYDLFLGFNFL
jgi:hypothetical protein